MQCLHVNDLTFQQTHVVYGDGVNKDFVINIVYKSYHVLYSNQKYSCNLRPMWDQFNVYKTL